MSSKITIRAKCYECKRVFEQTLFIGDYPFCPKCGSYDIVSLPKAETEVARKNEG